MDLPSIKPVDKPSYRRHRLSKSRRIDEVDIATTAYRSADAAYQGRSAQRKASGDSQRAQEEQTSSPYTKAPTTCSKQMRNMRSSPINSPNHHGATIKLLFADKQIYLPSELGLSKH